jgi:Methyltransferase domain
LGTHCEIHVFDPDPSYGRKNDAEKKNIHYHPWGLKGEGDEDPSATNTMFKGQIFYSLPQLMDKLGHIGRRLNIAKGARSHRPSTGYRRLWTFDRFSSRRTLISLQRT